MTRKIVFQVEVEVYWNDKARTVQTLPLSEYKRPIGETSGQVWATCFASVKLTGLAAHGSAHMSVRTHYSCPTVLHDVEHTEDVLCSNFIFAPTEMVAVDRGSRATAPTSVGAPPKCRTPATLGRR